MTKAKLPALPSISTGNTALDNWIRAVSERLEVREGARGDKLEQVLTRRDLEELGLDTQQWARKSSNASGDILVQQPGGGYALVPIDAFSEALRKTKLYRDLSLKLDDPTRFDSLPEKIRTILLNDIAAEAAKRGADIQRLDYKLQSATESLAYTVQEVTASVQGAVAGVRQMSYANASDNSATAGQVTQVKARIDAVPVNAADIVSTIYANVGALPATGLPGKFYQVGAGAPYALYRWSGSAWVLGGSGTSATIEQTAIATADRVRGASADYVVKVNAGNAMAGFGLSASEDPSGTTSSDFIVQADKFALTSGYNFSQASTPSAASSGQTWYNTTTKLSYRSTAAGSGSWTPYTPVIPFGVDTATGTVYINGQVRINAGGTQLGSVGLGSAGVVAVVYYQGASPAAPNASTGSYNFTTNALTPPTGSVTWSASIPAASTTTTWVSSYTFVGTGTVNCTGAWSMPVAMVVSGTNGSPGLNTGIAYAYIRSASAPVTNPGAITYDFGSASITTVTLANSWSKTIPAGSDPLYLVAASASSTATTDSIGAGEWSSPVLLVQDGAAGLNSATVYLYQRNASATPPASVGGSAPANTLTYTFSNSTFTGTPPSGWFISPPSTGGDFLHVATATAASTTASDTILFSEWAAPKLLSQHGTNGKNYTMAITGGIRNVTFDSSGASPVPAQTDFTGVMYENGVQITPTSHTWSAGGHLSGTSSVSTFTPTCAGTFTATNNDFVTLTMVFGSVATVSETIPIAITKIGSTGRAYSLVINGGVRSFTYNAAGGSPTPAATAYSCTLYLDGASVTPASYNWSSGGHLSGTSAVASFTPTVAGTFNASNNDFVTLSVTHGSPSQTVSVSLPISVNKLGTNGKGYSLVINGGVRSIQYDTNGGSPAPGQTAFGMVLYEDGVSVTPSSYSWTSGGHLSGTSAVSTFTPTATGTFNASLNTFVSLTVTYAGQTINDMVPIAVSRVGAVGGTGARGSLTAYASGGVWSDATAQLTICNAAGVGNSSANLRIGDTVTISNNSSFAETRYWSGGGWVSPGVVIDGNLLVSGTLSANKIGAGSITSATLDSSGYVRAGGTSGVLGAPGSFTAPTVAGMGSFTTAGAFNLTGSAQAGVIAKSSSNPGAGVVGENSSGGADSVGVFGYGYYGAICRTPSWAGTGVVGQSSSTGPSIGVRGDTTSNGGSIGVWANGSPGGVPLYVTGAGTSSMAGPMTIAGSLVQTLANFQSSLGFSDYQKLPSGLIIQWSIYGSASNAGTTNTFPLAFPSGCVNVVAMHYGSSPGAAGSISAQSLTTTNAVFYNSGAATPVSIFYIALGY